MNANEVPEKFYLLPNGFISYFRNSDEDIEYIRKDAFVDKACDVFCKVCGHYPHTVPTYICRQDCDYFIDFKNYMNGR